jgi:hypothetical protein
MSEQISAIAESTGLMSEKLEQSRWESERQHRAVEDRVAAMESKQPGATWTPQID